MHEIEIEIERQDEGIKKDEECILIAKELGLDFQVKACMESIILYKKVKKIIKMGYERAFFEYGDMEKINIENYQKPMPLAVLKMLKKTTELNIFDVFEVWIDKDDKPMLIGKVLDNFDESWFLVTYW